MLQIKEIIPEADDDDIYFALNDTNGDVGAAIQQLVESSRVCFDSHIGMTQLARRMPY